MLRKAVFYFAIGLFSFAIGAGSTVLWRGLFGASAADGPQSAPCRRAPGDSGDESPKMSPQPASEGSRESCPSQKPASCRRVAFGEPLRETLRDQPASPVERVATAGEIARARAAMRELPKLCIQPGA